MSKSIAMIYVQKSQSKIMSKYNKKTVLIAFRTKQQIWWSQVSYDV